MDYTSMLNEIMNPATIKKAKLPHWGDDKYIYVEHDWHTVSNVGKNHVPFLCIVDGEKVGPAILHNCDMFKTNWVVF
jgi:hypothetical protein